ncbi:MAG: alpha/beta hydrolase [Chloroflexaceae bacterium]|jgi:pimeloyl-ACP methyl ester carboxylesterase|nr:alpha/beta hydrolase [Chloroflexaceae bacterium]
MDFNQHRTTITVSGSVPVRLSVIDVGPLKSPGRGTVVCIHGAGGTATQWEKQLAHLAPNYRVIAPDLRGHGQSEKPDSAYSLEEFLWDFTQLLSVMKVEEPFTLMAHSFGGPIAITFAATQAARLNRLVLIATGPEMGLNPLQEFVIKSPLPLKYLEFIRPILWPKTYAPVFVLQKLLGGTLFHWKGYRLLPQVRVPTLVIGGQWDFIVSEAMARKTAELLPDARLEIVRYTRHLTHLERPEAVNRMLDRFLEGATSWREAEAAEPRPDSDDKVTARKAEG